MSLYEKQKMKERERQNCRKAAVALQEELTIAKFLQCSLAAAVDTHIQSSFFAFGLSLFFSFIIFFILIIFSVDRQQFAGYDVNIQLKNLKSNCNI